MRRLVAALPLVALAACFTTTADFQRDAENFITGDETLSDALDTSFESATCAEPPNQNVGTTFACTGVDEQNRTWEFEVEIIGDNEYEVNVTRFP